MPKFWLAGAADEDLLGIARYGGVNFGPEASDAYRERLKVHFSRLAENPYLYPAVDHIKHGVRRSLCGVHVIYYRVADDGVEIMRILRDAAATHENAVGTDLETERHQAVADLINAIIAGGNSDRRA